MNILRIIFEISSKKIKKLYFIFFFICIINSLIEICAISTVIPLLDIILNKNNIFTDKFYQFILKYFYINLTNSKNIIFFIATIFFVKFIFNLYTMYFYQRIIYELRLYLSQISINNYIKKDYIFFINNNSSKLLKNIFIEIPRVIFGVIATILLSISEIVMILFILSLFIFVSLESSLLIFSTIIFFSVIFITFSKKKVNNYGRQRQEAEGLALKNAKEIFENIQLLKIYQKENFFLNNFYLNNSLSAKSSMFHNFFAQSPRLFFEFTLVTFLLFLVIFFSSNLDKLIFIFAIFAAGAVKLIPSFSKLITAIQNIRFDSVALHEIYKDLKDAPNETILTKPHSGRPRMIFNNRIKFEKVAFQYSSSNKVIFKNIDLEIKKNEFIGIIGLSGSGKSTFFDLISGLIKPTHGSIYIDQKVLRDKNISDWQSNIGYMTQNTMLMDSSILENIAFGENYRSVSMERLNDSIDNSQLRDLVDNLPAKENTIIGERGLKLSGGERQRIALARTFYLESEVLLLDEITNSLDDMNEQLILKVISSIKNKTKILITHNRNSLKFCERVFRVKNNSISLVKVKDI